jgi:CBS-domain-containing membrane protein
VSLIKAKKFFYTNFYNQKFSDNKVHYFAQCLSASLVIFFVLMALKVVSDGVIIASIASTTFIVFATPHSRWARLRYVVGGYLVGMLSGAFFYGLLCVIDRFFDFSLPYYEPILGALAVGLSLFLMLFFQVEHPPASALALALTIDEWSAWSLFVTVLALLCLNTYRKWLLPHLIDLI